MQGENEIRSQVKISIYRTRSFERGLPVPRVLLHCLLLLFIVPPLIAFSSFVAAYRILFYVRVLPFLPASSSVFLLRLLICFFSCFILLMYRLRVL